MNKPDLEIYPAELFAKYQSDITNINLTFSVPCSKETEQARVILQKEYHDRKRNS